MKDRVRIGGKYHKKSSPSRNNRLLPRNILNTNSRQTDRNHRPKPKDLFHQSGYVGDFFFDETLLPRVSIWVDFHDLVVGSLLDFLAVRGGEVGDSHD